MAGMGSTEPQRLNEKKAEPTAHDQHVIQSGFEHFDRPNPSCYYTTALSFAGPPPTDAGFAPCSALLLPCRTCHKMFEVTLVRYTRATVGLL